MQNMCVFDYILFKVDENDAKIVLYFFLIKNIHSLQDNFLCNSLLISDAKYSDSGKEMSNLFAICEFFLARKERFAEVSKNLTIDTELKIILLNHQSNYIRH